MSRLILAWRQLRSDAGPLITVAAVLFVTALLAAGLPRWLNEVDDKAVVQAVEQSKPGDLIGTRSVSADLSQVDIVQDLTSNDARIRDGFDPVLQHILGPSVATLQTTAMLITSIDGVGIPVGTAKKTLIGRVLVTDQPVARYVDGTEPTTGQVRTGPFSYISPAYDSPAVQLDESEFALSTECANSLDIDVGSSLVVQSHGENLLLRVSGTFEPIDPGAYVWKRNTGLVVPTIEQGPSGITGITCDALFTGASFATLATAYNALPPGALQRPIPSTFVSQWQMPVVPSRLDARSVDSLLLALDRAETGQVGFAAGAIKVSTSLQNPLESFLSQQSAAHAVIAIGTAGAMAIAITVLALAAQLTISRRRVALVLARARGSSLSQLLALVTIEGTVAAGIAGAAGWWLASVVIQARAPGDLGARLVIVLAVSAVLALIGATLATLRSGTTGDRDSVSSSTRSPRRAAAEVGLIGLAVTGILLLRQRGFDASVVGAKVDPLLVTAPVLVAVAAAVLALRAYPFPLRVLGRAAAARAGAIGFLGLSRAARASAVSVAPLLALLIATSFAVFGSVVQHSVQAEQEIVAWDRVGAYLRVDGTDFNPADDVSRIAVAAGVPATGVVGIHRSETALIDDQGGTGQRFDLLLLDAQAYADFIRNTPIDSTAIDALASAPATVETVVPAVVSSALQRKIDSTGQTGNFFLPGAQATLDPVAITNDFPGLSPTALWAIARTSDAEVVKDLPYWPTILLLDAPHAKPDAVTAAVRKTQPFSVVTSRAVVYDELATAPLISATSHAFEWTALIAAAYCVLTVILGLVVTAGTRARFLAYVRTVGLADRQARSLVAMEVVPLATFAIVAGVILGVLIPRAVLPAIDLRPFTGGVELPPIRIPPLEVAGLGVGLMIVVGLAVFTVAAIDRRRGLGSMLRLGEDR